METNASQTREILQLQEIKKTYETKIIQLQTKERARLDLANKFIYDFKKA